MLKLKVLSAPLAVATPEILPKLPELTALLEACRKPDPGFAPI